MLRITLFLVAMCSAAVRADDRLEALEEQAFREAAALVAPSVVKIETIGGLEQLEPGLSASGVTSGVVVSADGDIITSAYTFAGKPTSIVVTLADGRRFPAKKIATDRQRMMTLLKIDADNLTPAKPAPRSSFHVGQWAIAIGRTFDGESPSVSVGIVSALDRIWGKAIQTDAKVSPVNYGGPLVDIEGQVLGVLAPLSPQASGEAAGVEWYDSGIGFAVPLVDIVAVLDRLKKGDDLLPGLMGVTFRSRGAIGGEPLVDRVRLNSPAAKAGLKKEDRVVAVDGIAVTNLTQFRQVLGRKYAGDDLQLELQRGDEKLPAKITLVGELPAYEAGFLGILPSRVPDAKAIIRVVLPDSPAAAAGLESKDEITQWKDVAVTSASQLRDLISRMPPDEEGQLTFRRGEETKTITVKLAAYPVTVPKQVPADVLDDSSEAKEAAPKTGRIAETLAGHDREYWLYVPESYSKGRAQGLMVFVHPPGQPMDTAILRGWKAECDRRGIIILAPQNDSRRGWTPNDLEFLRDCLAKVKQDYTIAPERIWLHAMDESAKIASIWCFRDRKEFRGLALLDAPLPGAPPDTDPEARLQLYFACDEKSTHHRAVKQSAEATQKARYPTVFAISPVSSGEYLGSTAVEELARWADSLDRI